MPYVFRSEAVLAAAMKSIPCFETFKTSDGKWDVVRAEPNPMWEHAVILASNHRDFVSHAEPCATGAKLIVTCRKEEITEEFPAYITIEPLVFETWEDQKSVPPRGAEKPTTEVPKPPRKEGSVKRVWDLCNANKNLSRKELVALCVANGINPSTASVQVSAWSKANLTENSA